jgi:hypothetical protein
MSVDSHPFRVSETRLSRSWPQVVPEQKQGQRHDNRGALLGASQGLLVSALSTARAVQSNSAPGLSLSLCQPHFILARNNDGLILQASFAVLLRRPWSVIRSS